MYLDVLSVSMKHKIFGELHAAHVVIVDVDRIRYFDPKVFEQPPKPYGLVVLMLDRATAGCFLLHHATVPLPRENIYLEVDR